MPDYPKTHYEAEYAYLPGVFLTTNNKFPTIETARKVRDECRRKSVTGEARIIRYDAVIEEE